MLGGERGRIPRLDGGREGGNQEKDEARADLGGDEGHHRRRKVGPPDRLKPQPSPVRSAA
jgi:hypothetical protein